MNALHFTLEISLTCTPVEGGLDVGAEHRRLVAGESSSLG